MSGLPRRPVGGFTLVEVLLGAALGLALLTLLVDVLVPMMNATQRGSVQSALQQTGVTLLDKVTTDLQRSVWSGLSATNTTGQAILGMHRLDQLAANGSQLYEDHMVVYLWQQKPANVWRLEAAPNDPNFSTSSPYLASPNTLTTLATNQAPTQSRIVACYVRGLDFQLDSTLTSLQTHLILSSSVPGRQDLETLELARTVSLRNATL